MISSFSPPRHCDWRTLYRAAILETDRAVIRRRVAQAEQAVLARGRELFHGSGTYGPEFLKRTLCLTAFRTAWEHTEAAEAA
jgi:hypothetical protein